MSPLLRVPVIMLAAAFLMGSGTCTMPDGGGRGGTPPGYTPAPWWRGGSGTPAAVAPLGSWEAVVWWRPSTYYNPAYNMTPCKAGYTSTVVGGRPYCMSCPAPSGLVLIGGEYQCAKCSPGYAYVINAGRPYCFKA